MRKKHNHNVNEILMNETSKYCKIYGEEILKDVERINKEEKEKLTEEQINKFKILCDIHYKEGKKKKEYSRMKIAVYRMATIMCVILLMFNISVVSVPAMKQITLGFLTDYKDTHTDIYIDENEKKYSTDYYSKGDNLHLKLSEEYKITYLPSGYKIVTTSKSEIGWNADYYDPTNDKTIMFEQSAIDTNLSIDTEDCSVKYVDINDTQALVSIKDNKEGIIVIWRLDDWYILISGINVDEKEILDIARSVKSNK